MQINRTELHSGYCSLVIDGDTFDVRLGPRIRLARVNAPELNQPGGLSAKRYLESLVFQKWLTYKVVGQSYGRGVAEVWINGYSVNDAMIAAGYK